MPKFPDPTLDSSVKRPITPDQKPPVITGEFQMPKTPETPPRPASSASNSPAAPAVIKKSPFRFFGAALAAVAIIGGGYLFTRYLILPLLNRQPKSSAVTLTYWGLWEPAGVIQPVIAKFEADHPHIKINYQMQSKQEYRERLQSALARGEGPDIMRIHASWSPMFNSHLLSATEEQFSVEEFNQIYYPVMTKDLINNNAVSAVPLMIDGLGLFVNNEVFKESAAAIPSNWDDFRQTAFDLTQRDQSGRITRSGAAMGTTGNISHWPDILAILMLQNSVNLARPDTTVNAQGRNLGADALRFYTIFASEDRVWDETLPNDIISFANGKVAMIIAPSWEVFQIQELNSKLDFSIYPIPQLTSQKQINWASYWVEAVSQNTRYPAEAWQFLKYFSSSEALQIAYSEASKIRAFGELYPRRDMAGLLDKSGYTKPFIASAASAQSWYMSSSTGDNGINDEIISYYQDAINSIVGSRRSSPEEALRTAALGVSQVLTKYGVK